MSVEERRAKKLKLKVQKSPEYLAIRKRLFDSQKRAKGTLSFEELEVYLLEAYIQGRQDVRKGMNG